MNFGDIPVKYELKGGIYLPEDRGMIMTKGEFLLMYGEFSGTIKSGLDHRIIGILVNDQQIYTNYKGEQRDILMFYLLNENGLTNTSFELTKPACIPYIPAGHDFSGTYSGRQLVGQRFSIDTPKAKMLVEQIRYLEMDAKGYKTHEVSFELTKL